MPHAYPDRLEAGTGAGPAIAALGAGVDFVHKTGASLIAEHEHLLSAHFREWCHSKSWIKVAGKSFTNQKTFQVLETSPIVSFSVEGHSPDRIADTLNSEYSIAVRPGLHCAAHAHRTLGTTATGLVRVSFGFFNTLDEVEILCNALARMNAT
jgi:cysteine desulfurase / selenocysteine lyase